MTVYYLGQFPPPYGGVTVKNALLSEFLSQRVSLKIFNFRKTNTAKIVFALLTSKDDYFYIGFGNHKFQRALVNTLAIIKPSVLPRCFLVAMGGMLPHSLENNARYRKSCSKISRIYVETKSMAKRINELGMANVSVYPNCRKRPATVYTANKNEDVLKCVFFSLIGPNKGADVVLDAAEHLPGVEFHFYGHIEQSFKDTFDACISRLPNAFYHGVFDSVNNDAVAELSKYDVHIFPSRWISEGVPGVLAETKIAGVPSIVSNISYNAELVESGYDGIVLEECTAAALCRAIEELNADRNLLYSMKKAALVSAENYYVDCYIDGMISDLEEAQGKASS